MPKFFTTKRVTVGDRTFPVGELSVEDVQYLNVRLTGLETRPWFKVELDQTPEQVVEEPKRGPGRPRKNAS